MRQLTLEDVEDIVVDPNWSPLDILGAVCERASEIHQKENSEINKKIPIQQSSNSPSRMVEFPKSPIRKEDTNSSSRIARNNSKNVIVDGDDRKRTKIIMKRWEKDNFKKRVMGFDMIGFTSWKSNITTTDVLTWSVKDEFDKKISDQKENSEKKQEDNSLCHEEILRREKKLKRPTDDEVEQRILIRGSPSGLRRKRSQISDDQEEICVVKKKKHFKRTESEINPHVELPAIFKNRINELGKKVKEMKLIIEKEVYKTDASESHNRLSIPAAQVKEKFLRDEEEEYLRARSNIGKHVNSKTVRVMEPSLKIGELELRRWEMKKVKKDVMKNLNYKQKQKEECKTSVSYVLNGKWTDMRIDNNIKEGNRIQIWAVRMDDDELIILLVKLPHDDEEEEQVHIEDSREQEARDDK